MQLDFRVDEQTLSWVGKKNVVADSVNYLTCKFTFSEEWSDIVKTASFFTSQGKAYSTILENDMCYVPHEVIKYPLFKVSVAGGDLITTNKIIVSVIESGYVKGETPKPPTPDVYTQILEKCDEAVNTAKDVEQRADNGEFDGEKGDKGDKGDDYVLTEKDKEEIAGKVNAPKVVNVDNLFDVPVEEFPNASPSVTLWARDASGSAYGGGGVVCCDDLDGMIRNGQTDADKVGKIGQDRYGNIHADLKPAFTHADEKLEESKEYTDNKIASILKGSASGEVIAIDDISPVNKKIDVDMSSKNLFKINSAINGKTSNLTITNGSTVSSIIINGSNTGTNATGYTIIDKITLDAGTYTASINGLNVVSSSADRLNINNGGVSPATAITNTGINGFKTFTLTEKTIIQFTIIFGAGTTYENKEVEIQIEKGSKATGYTPYLADVSNVGVYVYGVDEESKVHYPYWWLFEEDYKVNGLYPNTTIMVDTVGAIMDVEYSRDLNKAFEELTQAIISLGGNV